MAQYYIHNGQLYHHGVKGQKWGVRRYQNKDGSLTKAGKARYENEDGSLNEEGKKFYRERDAESRASERAAVKDPAKNTVLAKNMIKDEVEMLENEKKLESLRPKEKSGLEKTKDLVDATADAAKTAQRLERSIPTKQTKMDLSNMSDKQMRDEINRAVLERQYNDMFAPKTTSKGRERLRQVLEIGGTVLAVGGSALSIAVGIKSLIGK